MHKPLSSDSIWFQLLKEVTMVSTKPLAIYNFSVHKYAKCSAGLDSDKSLFVNKNDEPSNNRPVNPHLGLHLFLPFPSILSSSFTICYFSILPSHILCLCIFGFVHHLSLISPLTRFNLLAASFVLPPTLPPFQLSPNPSQSV